MTGRLAGRVAIITGASRGLGRHCAIGFAREGATVIVAGRTLDEAGDTPGTLQETVAEIANGGGTALAVRCNVSDKEAVATLAKTAVDRFGRIDTLMTNAVYYAPGTISTMSAADWELQFAVNVHGVFHAVRAVLPTMIQQRAGNIITVSSVAAERASHYGATKRAVVGMTLAFAQEQRENKVAVNALRPVAGIATPGWLNARDSKSRQARAHRLSPPDSYVEAAVLLAMRTAQECSGETLTDADVLQRFGSAGSYDRFAAMNAPVWSGRGE